jgi:hypothetical protein
MAGYASLTHPTIYRRSKKLVLRRSQASPFRSARFASQTASRRLTVSGCYAPTLLIETANWEISAAPTLPLDRQHERAKLLMVDLDLDVAAGADGFELRSEVCGDEDESLVFFQAGVM